MPSQPRGIDAVGDLVVVACINDVRKYFLGGFIDTEFSVSVSDELSTC